MQTPRIKHRHCSVIICELGCSKNQPVESSLFPLETFVLVSEALGNAWP